jgi:hypothetical protein
MHKMETMIQSIQNIKTVATYIRALELPLAWHEVKYKSVLLYALRLLKGIKIEQIKNTATKGYEQVQNSMTR